MAPKRFDDADRRLDLREIDGEPFENIMAALEELSDSESLLLINSFEPEPLYDVLQQRGYEFEAANPAPEKWQIEITRA